MQDYLPPEPIGKQNYLAPTVLSMSFTGASCNKSANRSSLTCFFETIISSSMCLPSISWQQTFFLSFSTNKPEMKESHDCTFYFFHAHEHPGEKTLSSGPCEHEQVDHCQRKPTDYGRGRQHQSVRLKFLK